MTLRIGLGLAAVGRPGYINLGRGSDLPGVRTTEALRERAFELMDEAYGRGVRYFDAARSYGLAETYLAQWLHTRRDVTDVMVGSKWGYTYTADWRTAAGLRLTPAQLERLTILAEPAPTYWATRSALPWT